MCIRDRAPAKLGIIAQIDLILLIISIICQFLTIANFFECIYVVFHWVECFPWQLLSILILCFFAVPPQVCYNTLKMKFNICWGGWSKNLLAKITDVFHQTKSTNQAHTLNSLCLTRCVSPNQINKSSSHLTLAMFDQMCFTKSNQQIKLTP